MNKENSNLKKNIWVLAKILSGHMISKYIPELPRQVGLEKYRPGIHTPVPGVPRSSDQAVRGSVVQAVVDLGRNIRPFRVQNRRNMYTYNLFKYSNCCSASDNNKDTYYFLINPDEDEKLSEMASMVSEGAFRPVFRDINDHHLTVAP